MELTYLLRSLNFLQEKILNQLKICKILILMDKNDLARIF